MSTSFLLKCAILVITSQISFIVNYTLGVLSFDFGWNLPQNQSKTELKNTRCGELQ